MEEAARAVLRRGRFRSVAVHRCDRRRATLDLHLGLTAGRPRATTGRGAHRRGLERLLLACPRPWPDPRQFEARLLWDILHPGCRPTLLARPR